MTSLACAVHGGSLIAGIDVDAPVEVSNELPVIEPGVVLEGASGVWLGTLVLLAVLITVALTLRQRQVTSQDAS